MRPNTYLVGVEAPGLDASVMDTGLACRAADFLADLVRIYRGDDSGLVRGPIHGQIIRLTPGVASGQRLPAPDDVLLRF